jgi:hypothetical protein
MNEQKRHYSTMTAAELADWDAEIEADFQREVEEAMRTARRQRGRSYIHCPWEFLADVCRLTRGRTALVVALCVYRRVLIHRGQAVTLKGAELAELGVDPRRKREALHKLEAVGILQLHQTKPGRKTKVTLLWRPTEP